MPDPPSPARRRSYARLALRAVGALAALAIGALGWQLGTAATRLPTISLGSALDDSITVWAVGDAAPVEFSWTLQPSGRLAMYLSVDEAHRDRAHTYMIVLGCDARLATFDENSDQLSVRTLHPDSDCGGSYTERATQIVGVSVDTAGIAAVRGVPVARWTASASGQRVARTPLLSLGTTVPEISGYDPAGLRPPDPRSSITVTLIGGTAEALESYLPVDVAQGGRTTIESMELDVGDEAMGSAVSWSRDYSTTPRTDDQPSGIAAATARWSDPQGVANAQRSLLLSGVFLGVAASLAVEGVFALVRGRRPESSGNP